MIYQDILEQGLQRGRQEGRQEGETLLVVRLLKRRIGLLEDELETCIRSLSVEQLEALGEALLDFTQSADLVNWLENQTDQ